MDLVKSIADHIIECIEACVFGQKNINNELPFVKDGVITKIKMS